MMIHDGETGESFDGAMLMGVYLFDRDVRTPDAAASIVRDIALDATRVPEFTLIADDPSEAAAILVDDGDLQEMLELESVEFPEQTILGGGRIVQLNFHGGSRLALVNPVSELVRNELTPLIPSPFTQEPGSLRRQS